MLLSEVASPADSGNVCGLDWPAEAVAADDALRPPSRRRRSVGGSVASSGLHDGGSG